MVKELIGIIAVILTFVGYVPYIRDTLKGKTKPHIYTWFIWGFVTAIAYALQVADHAGPGALVTLAAAIVCLFIFAVGLRSGDRDITKLDTVFLVLAFVALGVWVFAKEPTLSVILLSSVDILGFLPTVRKSWSKPYQETLFSYEMNTFRFALAILALERYTLISSLYPITWIVANGLFSVFLIVRRRQIKR
jgi:hypothetical protein